MQFINQRRQGFDVSARTRETNVIALIDVVRKCHTSEPLSLQTINNSMRLQGP